MNGIEQPPANNQPHIYKDNPLNRPIFINIVTFKKRLSFLGLCLLTFLIVGCREADQTSVPVAQITATLPALSTPQPTVTATLIPTATSTPSPTQTASPTPPPTATAVPAKLFGNPRTSSLTRTPEPRSGAPCGLIDIFDFPIAPSDGVGVSRGGGDFGQFRQRYDKYHTGEDWGGAGSGSNFGKPVFSIGHGRVMYAAPEGWNRDKGVVIVEHAVQTQTDQQIVYSFYGHLDPPSVVLEPGSCVRRGEHVGNIGDPLTPPHLHFEIRTHMPYAPGPGYWEEDPTTAGWLSPSQTIWNQRMAASPGVSWLRSTTSYSQPIGLWRENFFLTIENGRLTQTNLETGASQPSPLVGKEIENGFRHEQTGTLFLETADDVLMAFGDELLWQVELDGNACAKCNRSSRSDLLPLPEGGVMVMRDGKATGVAADGVVLWQIDGGKRPFAWTLTNDTLIYTVSGVNGGIWSVTNNQPPALVSNKTGYPIPVGKDIWLYAANGIYRLNSDSTELLYALPTAKLNFSAITPLPDGGALILHTDDHDRRLISLNQDGTLRWNLSVSPLLYGTTQLVNTTQQTLLFIDGSDGNNLQTFVYDVDSKIGNLTHIFNGGSRPFSRDDTWIMPASSQMLINSAGGAILAFDPDQAVNIIITSGRLP